jgi:hypothetical protein
MLLVGSIVMGISMVIVGIIVAKFRHDWPGHVAAGWTAVGKSLNLIHNVFLRLL